MLPVLFPSLSRSSPHFLFLITLLLFGSLLLICFLIRIKAPERQGSPLLCSLLYWKTWNRPCDTGGAQGTTYGMLLNDSWLLSSYHVYTSGRRCDGFCVGQIGGLHLELSNALCRELSPWSIRQTPRFSLELPSQKPSLALTPKAVLRYLFFLALGAPVSNL